MTQQTVDYDLSELFRNIYEQYVNTSIGAERVSFGLFDYSSDEQMLYEKLSIDEQWKGNSCFPMQKMATDLSDLLSIRVSFIILYAIIFICGLVFNGGVFFVVFKNKNMRSSSDILLLNLMGSDILLCLTSNIMSPMNAFTKEWRLPAIMCNLLSLTQPVTVLVSTWSLCTVSIDKCVHIVNPHRGRLSLKKAFIFSIMVWSCALIINIPFIVYSGIIFGTEYIITINTSTDNQIYILKKPLCGQFCEERWPTTSVKRVYGTSILICQFLIPTVVISFCHSKIFIKVKKEFLVNGHSDNKPRLTADRRILALQLRKQVTTILLGMVVTFVICWLPQISLNVMRDFDITPEVIIRELYIVKLAVHSLAMTTVIWNPLLFFWLAWTRRMARKAHTSSHKKQFMTTTGSNGLPSDTWEFTTRTLPGMKNGALSGKGRSRYDSVIRYPKTSTNSARSSRALNLMRKPQSMQMTSMANSRLSNQQVMFNL